MSAPVRERYESSPARQSPDGGPSQIGTDRNTSATTELPIPRAPRKSEISVHWGTPPWKVAYRPPAKPLPKSVDVAILGGGFTGLAAAAQLRRLDPQLSVAVFEAHSIGHGASGRTGGIVLGETAAGDKPGLGNVLAAFPRILEALEVRCDLELGGAWEIARRESLAHSPIAWEDSGTLRVVKEVPGGSLDPGKMVAGLARAAVRHGALIYENRRAESVDWKSPAEITFSRDGVREFVRAEKILFATNALSLALAGYKEQGSPRLTLAALTAPLPQKTLEAIGYAKGKPFYTVDFPYLWGRLRRDRSILWGAGLVTAPSSRDLETLDISSEEPTRAFATLEGRLRQLHPALSDLRVTHRWGGPILFRENWTPVFQHHPESRHAIVLGAYAGHGVALSVYLGTWAAEALLGKRDLPPWGVLS